MFAKCNTECSINNDRVILLEEDLDINLRIGNKLLDIHSFVKKRLYFDRYVDSNVEFYLRKLSATFPEFHAKLLKPYLKNAIIVDIGCGQLPGINAFPNTDIQSYYGVDLSRESLDIASQHFSRDFPLLLVQHNVSSVPFEDDAVDIVICSEVIEHLNDPMEHLSECYRILKPGGYLSLPTPCSSRYLYPFNFLSILLGKHKAVLWYRLLNAHEHWSEALAWHPALQPRILRAWVEATGFKVEWHGTILWYHHTPVHLFLRIFTFLEKIRVPFAARSYELFLRFHEDLLASNLPGIRWAGIRQFILCRKKLEQFH